MSLLRCVRSAMQIFLPTRTHNNLNTLPRKIAARPRLSLSFLIFSRERERERVSSFERVVSWFNV